MAEVRAGRPEAASVVWTWREAPARPRRTSPREMRGVRIRGSLQAAAAAAVGAALIALGLRVPGTLVLLVACTLLLAALLSPAGLFPLLQRGFLALGRATGRVLTWVLLVPVFYLFFVPFGRLLRRGRRDRLRRSLEPEAETYWEPHEGLTAASGSHRNPY